MYTTYVSNEDMDRIESIIKITEAYHKLCKEKIEDYQEIERLKLQICKLNNDIEGYDRINKNQFKIITESCQYKKAFNDLLDKLKKN